MRFSGAPERADKLKFGFVSNLATHDPYECSVLGRPAPIRACGARLACSSMNPYILKLICVPLAMAAACGAATSGNCPADGNGDGAVDGGDLSSTLNAWGQPSAYDLNGDGTTDGSDLAAVLQAWGPCETPAPTDGFTQVPFTHYIQFPWDLQLSDRYSLTNGVHDFKVYNTDQPFQSGSTTQPRTEMRINNNYTSGIWQFEGDLFVPTGTTGVAVMQVFGGSTSSTSCQLRVYNGSLCYYTTPIMNNIHDTWIHVNVIHDANAHTVSVYLNGTLVRSAPDRGPATYYFKCGVYQQSNSSSLMQSQWANIKVWQQSPL